MQLSFKVRRKIFKNSNYLDLTPVRLPKEEISEEKIVTILIPKFQSKFAAKYIVPIMKSPVIKLKLDELGSATWLLIDGKKNVGEIARMLIEKYGEKINPVYERLPKFFTDLYEQHLITFQEITK